MIVAACFVVSGLLYKVYLGRRRNPHFEKGALFTLSNIYQSQAYSPPTHKKQTTKSLDKGGKIFKLIKNIMYFCFS